MNTEPQHENITTENNINSTERSPSSPPPAGPKRGRPLSRLLALSERQLEHVNAWLKEGVPYREIVKLCRTEFQHEIPYMTFVRYSNRTEFIRQLDSFTDSREAAAELSQYAATGDPTFSTNTLQLLESQAFDLAAAHHRDADADDLSLLTKLWALIHKAKGTSIRERHAAVQEQKVALRREELALKRELTTAHLKVGPVVPNGPLTDAQYPQPSANQTPSTNDLGRGTERISIQANISSDVFHPFPTSPSHSDLNRADADAISPLPNHGRGEFHPRPTSTSRDAINPDHAASADQRTTQDSESKTQDSNSEPRTNIQSDLVLSQLVEDQQNH